MYNVHLNCHVPYAGPVHCTLYSLQCTGHNLSGDKLRYAYLI